MRLIKTCVGSERHRAPFVEMVLVEQSLVSENYYIISAIIFKLLQSVMETKPTSLFSLCKASL